MEKRLKQDIGLDQDGFIEVLIERGTSLPHEFSCRIQLNGNRELLLYEGNHVTTNENTRLGSYSLDIQETFVFSLHISEQFVMKVLINEKLVDTIHCTQLADDVPMEETRKFLNAKKEFVDYVESTLLFLQDPMTQRHVPEWKWAIEKLEWAKQIVDYPVSAEEYNLALHEIEYLIHPLLQNTNHKIERTSLE
jgi:hypothetical protein